MSTETKYDASSMAVISDDGWGQRACGESRGHARKQRRWETRNEKRKKTNILDAPSTTGICDDTAAGMTATGWVQTGPGGTALIDGMNLPSMAALTLLTSKGIWAGAPTDDATVDMTYCCSGMLILLSSPIIRNHNYDDRNPSTSIAAERDNVRAVSG